MIQGDKRLFKRVGKVVSAILILFVFLFSIDLMVISLDHLGKETIESLVSVTANPFVSLFIGLLVTAIVQSSSTTTSVIVAMVASGSMDISNAIPMVMGANIGTTITSDLVSLSFIPRKLEFKRAITVATAHDFFNIITTAILFPLQYFCNFLGGLSEMVSGLLIDFEGDENAPGFFFTLFKNMPVSDWVFHLTGNRAVSLVLSVVLLFASIKLMSNIIYTLLIGDSKQRLGKYVFNNPLKSFSWGMFITAAMQSSSVTTSILVPVVAKRKTKAQYAFPFILGANIGTTITALLAAVFKNEAAITIAIAHFLFNLIGVLIFLPFSKIRNIPIVIAQNLGAVTLKYRIAGFIYIIVMFFLIPFALIWLSK